MRNGQFRGLSADIWGSFRPSFYKEIVAQGFVSTLKFLAVVIFFISLAFSAQYALEFKRMSSRTVSWIKANLPDVIEEFPEVWIENGQARANPQDPFVRFWDKLGFLLVIDTTKEAEDVSSLAGYDNAFMLTRGKLITKTLRKGDNYDIKVYRLPEVRKFHFIPGDRKKGEIFKVNLNGNTFIATPSNLNRWKRRLDMLAFPYFLVVLIVYFFLAKLIQIYSFSLLSLTVNALSRAGLNFTGLLNIGAYALIPPTALAMLVNLGRLRFGGFGLIYLGLYAAYIIAAILDCRKTEQTADAGLEIYSRKS
jgi:hypothetical protein